MVGQISGHGRGGAQTGMNGTEVVDDARPEHLIAQALTALGQVAGTPCQRRQAAAKRRVQAFDEGGVDAAEFTLTAGNQLIDALAAAMDDPALDAGQKAAAVVLDDLDDMQVSPGDARRAADLAATHDRREMLEDDLGVSRKAIHRDQDRLDTVGGATHLGEELVDQTGVPVGTDFAPQKQPGKDAHGRGHPDFAVLGVDTQLIGLHLTEFDTPVTDDGRLNLLRMGARFALPSQHRARIEHEGHRNRRHRAAMRQQRQDQHDDPHRVLQIVQRRAVALGERAFAGVTDVASFGLAMHADAPRGLAMRARHQFGMERRLFHEG